MEAEIQPDPGKFGEGGGCSSNSASTLQANEVWQFTNMLKDFPSKGIQQH